MNKLQSNSVQGIGCLARIGRLAPEEPASSPITAGMGIATDEHRRMPVGEAANSSSAAIMNARMGSIDVTCATTITEPETTTRVAPNTGDGDHDRFAHYVLKAVSVRAYVEGTPIRALCGKVWVPSRDPSRYPLCPTCVKIREGIPSRGKA